MMTGRAVGCSLADAFSGPTVTPTVATYQSRLTTAQAQMSSHAKQQAAASSPYAAGAMVAPAPPPFSSPAPQPPVQDVSSSDTDDTSDSDDEEAYHRFVRRERRKRRVKKLAHKTRRKRRPVDTDTDTDTETDSEIQASAVRSQPQPQPQPQPAAAMDAGRPSGNIVVAQGTTYPIASSYVRQSVGQASFAGALPAQGFSVAAATMGPPGSCVPQNPLGVDFGTGSNMYATGYSNNGMPQAVLDGRFDTIRSDRRDLAGTFVDPITGIAYAGFTDSMPEPKVMREPPTIKLGEPSRMLEALTGVPAYKRPMRQEVLNDFSDVLEGVQIPQGLLELQARDNAAKRVAADTFFTNNETENGFNDTHWDGFIGDTFVLRPVIDTQTLSDNSQTNTVVAPFRAMPDIYSSTFQINDGTQWGGPLQPSVTVLGRDKATLPGRGSVDMPSLGQHVRLPGIPTQLPFSDDAPTTHANTPFVSQYGGGGAGTAASLAAVSMSSQDATRASVANQTVDMPYALYTPPAALATAGSSRDEAVSARPVSALQDAVPQTNGAVPVYEPASVTDATVARSSSAHAMPAGEYSTYSWNGHVDTTAANDAAVTAFRSVPLSVGNQYEYGIAAVATDLPAPTDSAASHRPAIVQTYDTSGMLGARTATANKGAGDASAAVQQVAASYLPHGSGTVTPWSLQPAGVGIGQSRDADVQSARRGATASQDFPYAIIGMAAAAPERNGGTDAALAPVLHHVAPNGTATYTSRSGMPSVASMVGAIEKASQRMASVTTDETHFRSAEAPTSAAPGHDVTAAFTHNTYGGGAVWKTAPDTLPAVREAANVIDDAPGALRVDADGLDGARARLQASRISDHGQDASTALSSGAATAAFDFQSSGTRIPNVRQSDMGTDAFASTRQANTYDSTSGRETTLTWSWDGPGQSFDDVARPASLNTTAAYETAGVNMGQASDRPAQLKAGSESTPRVANDMTLFSTGQSMLPTETLQSLPSQKDTGRDATKEGDAHVAHTSLLRDAFLLAHPSTYGKAAEYRNVYKTTTRAGIFVENLETQRAVGHPGQTMRDSALARQHARNEDVRRQEQRTGNGMSAVRVAYESDAYASDA